MSRRFFWVGVFVPLFLTGCSSEQPSNHTQLGDISNQSNDVAGDTSPLVQQDENLAYIETFPAEGQRKSLSTSPFSTGELTLAHQRFAFSDYAAHSSTDVNIVASPFDLQQLLAMVALGAEGTTIHALSNAAGFNFAE